MLTSWSCFSCLPTSFVDKCHAHVPSTVYPCIYEFLSLTLTLTRCVEDYLLTHRILQCLRDGKIVLKLVAEVLLMISRLQRMFMLRSTCLQEMPHLKCVLDAHWHHATVYVHL